MRCRIVIVRHAKSRPVLSSEDDHKRPLDERGRRESDEVGRSIATRGWAPTLVLCSDATRARETWRCLSNVLLPPRHVEYFRSLYHAGREAAVEALALADQQKTTGIVMLVGHNPGWEEMVSALAGKDITMKTAYAALFEAEAATFQAALAGNMTLVELLKPGEG